MDRNTILGFLLIAAILIGWSYFTAPSKEELEEARRKQDSIRIARTIEEASEKIEEIISVADTAQKSHSNIDTIPFQTEDYGVFNSAASGEHSNFSIENEVIRATFSNKGGRLDAIELKNYKTHAQEPLYIFKGDTNIFNISFFAQNRAINTSNLFFEPLLNNNPIEKDVIYVEKDQAVNLSFRLYAKNSEEETNSNSYIEFLYVISSNSYMVDFKINFTNMQNIVAANTSYINLDLLNVAPTQEKSIKNERAATTIYYKYLVDDVDYLSERKDDKKSLNNKLKWIAFKQQFFSTVIIAEDAFLNAEVETNTDEENIEFVKALKASIGIPFEISNNYTFEMSFYFGPNHYNSLKQYDLALEKLIPLGWGIFAWINRFAVIPVFNFLDSFNINYGIIILILTILIKILLFPIAFKTFSSSAKMRILKPDIEEINAKFPKKEDALKKQQAVMSLYKKAGVNPMAGCLPMLLQLPILIAMFRFFPASFELRQEAFLWADDLSTYDSILDLPFTIPFYGSHVSLFTLLMTISTIIYTKMNTEMMGSSNQMPGMKTMMYFMPIMFLGIFNNFASALSYYYFLTNIITFLQMYIFRFIIDEEALKKKIEANKSRKITAKKSGFQKRLEEIAKKKGYNPKK